MKRRIFLLLILLYYTGNVSLCAQQIADSSITVESIIITGNKKTKPKVIHRELLFAEGDTLQKTKIKSIAEQSRKNLLNLSLFNFVSIEYFTRDSLKYSFIIDVTERWYTWPNPIFEISERNFNSWWDDKDFNRINYGFFIEQQNFRGRNEKLKWLMRFGYDERYTFSYKIPFINKAQTIGMGLDVGIKRNHEIAYQTYNNKLEHIKDENKYLFKQYFSSINFSIRNKIHESHSFYLSYEQNEFGDTVLELNPDFSPNAAKEYNYLTLYYFYKNDHRDIKAYPLNGYYFDISAHKFGLGVFQKPGINHLFLKGSVRKYWHLYNRFYFASSLTGKASSLGKQPYHLIQGLGYGRDFVRGYEYYVVDGENFILSKSNLKFELIPTQVYNLKFIPTERFGKIHLALYLNTYLDIGYVNDIYYNTYNDLTNTWLIGGGAGLDLVTYYDKVLRIEYSINRMKETGLFLHFIAPI